MRKKNLQSLIIAETSDGREITYTIYDEKKDDGAVCQGQLD